MAGWESNPFAGPQVDFTDAAEAIGSIPQRLRDRELRGQNFIDPKTGAVDYNRMSQALMAAGHTKEALLAIDAGNSSRSNEEKFGLNPVPVWNQDLNGGKGGYEFYQSSSAGRDPRKMNFGKGQPAMGVTMKPTADGLRPFFNKLPAGGMGPDGYPSVGTAPQQSTDGVNMTPPMFSGGPQQAPQGATPPTQAPQAGAQAIPTTESVKTAHELASNKASDKAMSMQAIDEFEKNIRTLGNLVDPQGNPTDQLRAVTGNYKLPKELGGGEGGTEIPQIPNSWVPIDYSEKSRDARANLETAAIQVGLNALAKMRAASAQGASGMGQLAIQESEWLQKSIANLNDTQGTPQAAVHVQEVIAYSKLLQQRVAEKYKEVYGEDLPPPGDVSFAPPPGAPQASTVPGDAMAPPPTSTGVQWSIKSR